MRHYTFETVDEAYQHLLKDVWDNPEYKCAPRGQPIREVLDYGFTILNPSADPIKTLDEERNKVIADYTAKEVALYNSCSNNVEDFAKASKFWLKIANPDGTVNSAYGRLIWGQYSAGNMKYEKKMRTPWEWAKMSLEEDKDTRQALLRFSLSEHQWKGNKDQTCTLNGVFMIREDKLHFSITMRSNDLVKGTAYDLPWFMSLMDKMVEELKPTYPNLTKGSYTHLAHSMHIYERDKETIFKMVGAEDKQ